MADASSSSLPLAGIRVLDFGRYIAGPFCGTLLADMGADVIRIERRKGSEDRWIQPADPDKAESAGGEGAMFLHLNRNKRGMTLNPRAPAGREVVRKLVARSDVVIANLPPPTLVDLGLDYDSLAAVNPRIVLTTVSAFGRGGPYSERVGFDGVAQALSGSAWMSGDGTGPARAYAPWVDFGTASLAAFGTLAALRERETSGRGQMVEGALFLTAYAYMASHLVEETIRRINRPATGNRAQHAGPSDYAQTRDGKWVVIQVLGGPLFARFANLIGEPELVDDPRFATDLARGEHGESLSARFAAWAKNFDAETALEKLAEARIPAGIANDTRAAVDDPHAQALGLVQPLAYPGVKDAAAVATPLRLSRAPDVGPRTRAPTLGEHTDAILAELGYDAAAIAKLREDGAV